MHKYITNTSKIKLNHLKLNAIPDLNPKLQTLLTKMQSAFSANLKIELGNAKINYINKMFQEFITNILEITKSKFESDINSMDNCIGIKLYIGSDIIQLNFIFDKAELVDYIKYIAVIVHATNTFCHLFPHNYNKLEMNVCLDSNERNIDIPSHIQTVKNKIAYLQAESTAFNVSGVTYPHRRIINLTRREEMIKLLFHELIHFIGLDHVLVQANFKNKWAAKLDGGLNLSEAYTEFFSVILYATYESVHLSRLIPEKSDDIFKEILATEINYGIRLTSNILKFYDYDTQTYRNFFDGIGQKITQPILLVEYIFLRTILFLHLDEVLELISADYRIQTNNLSDLSKIFLDDSELITKLEPLMINKMDKSVSYLAIDLDWSLV